jgi:hypothetical protein
LPQDNLRSYLLVNIRAELTKTTLLSYILVFVYRVALEDVLLTNSRRVVSSRDKQGISDALIVRVLREIFKERSDLRKGPTQAFRDLYCVSIC